MSELIERVQECQEMAAFFLTRNDNEMAELYSAEAERLSKLIPVEVAELA